MEWLTYENLRHLPKLMEIAEFAEKAEKAIQSQSFEFKLGNSEVEVLRGNDYGECFYEATLTIDGTWNYHDNWWGGRNYSLKCTGEGIFEAFKSQLDDPDDNTRNCALSCFKDWVKSLPTWEETDMGGN